MDNTHNKVQYEAPIMTQSLLAAPKSQVLCASGDMSMPVSLQSMGEWQ